MATMCHTQLDPEVNRQREEMDKNRRAMKSIFGLADRDSDAEARELGPERGANRGPPKSTNALLIRLQRPYIYGVYMWAFCTTRTYT